VLAAHVAGSAALGWAGRHRGIAQQGMPTAMIVDTAASAVAVAAKVGGLRTLAPVLASVSVAAQGYLADQQRPGPSLRRLRAPPAERRWVRASALARALQDLGWPPLEHRALLAAAAVLRRLCGHRPLQPHLPAE
jgi:hypothetical protein